MKADCLAIIDAMNSAIWVRSATYSAELAAQALAEMRVANPESQLRLIKSFTDAHGVEKFVELMNPWADACLSAKNEGTEAPAKAVVEIWLAINPTFGFGPPVESFSSAEFRKSAAFLVPYRADDAEAALDTCFSETQNIDRNWCPGKGCRSSSVGDVFVVRTPEGRQAYIVASSGFKPVPFIEDSVEQVSSFRALAYLGRFSGREKVGETYDEDDMLRTALATLIPNFEYPDWSHKTLADVLRFANKSTAA